MNSLSLSDALAIAQITQALATVAAVIVGGYWAYRKYILGGEDFPRVKVEHKVVSRKIDENRTLLSIYITVTNIGEVFIRLDPMLMQVRQLLPLPVGPNYLIKKEGHNSILETEITNLDFLKLEPRFDRSSNKVEAGAIQQFHWDFIIKSEIKAIELASCFGHWGKVTSHDVISRKQQ